MKEESVRIFVEGIVQGVYFRQSLKKKAMKHIVCGWTRNLDDGRVEAVLQGSKKDVEKVIAWAKQGPPRARVTGVKEEWDDQSKKFDSFDIIY